MTSPATTIFAAALAVVLGSASLLARSLDGQEGSPPGAESSERAAAMVDGRVDPGVVTTFPTANSVPPNLLEYRGRTTEGMALEMSDARLEGTVTVDANLDLYGGGIAIFSGVLRIENDEGAWQGRPSVGVIFPDGSETANTFALDGEGAYAGLTAVLEFTTEPDVGWTVAGAIIPGDPPPTPAESAAAD